MLRQQVLKLYCSLLRAIRGITDEESKKEVLQWVRTDFRNNKHHTDEVSSQSHSNDLHSPHKNKARDGD
jgi:hypothetical protein